MLDIPVETNSTLPALQIFISGIFVDPTNYTYAVSGDKTTITLKTIDELGGIGSIIEVFITHEAILVVTVVVQPITRCPTGAW